MNPSKQNVKPLKVFLNSSLSHLASQMFNQKIKELLQEEGFTCILPQDILPPVSSTKPKDVFQQNVELIRQSDLVLSILDAPGEGVIFELGVAYSSNKPIIAFRSDKQGYLGKVIEGFWLLLPKYRKATTLKELRRSLKKFRTLKSIDYNKSES
jgi:nucleoside 2-deoxyribosyltransferase